MKKTKTVNETKLFFYESNKPNLPDKVISDMNVLLMANPNVSIKIKRYKGTISVIAMKLESI